MKIGFDLHGVLDENINIWRVLIHSFLKTGHEVHIITGVPKKRAKRELINLKINVSHTYIKIVSIVDNLIEKGFEYYVNGNGSKVFKDIIWDHEKAIYCKENNIDLYFDDREKDCIGFDTPCYILKKVA